MNVLFFISDETKRKVGSHCRLLQDDLSTIISKVAEYRVRIEAKKILKRLTIEKILEN
jgi:hypothetical protein